MPRIARVVVPGLPHHVTQRGNNRQDVFFTDDDRHLYLKVALVIILKEKEGLLQAIIGLFIGFIGGIGYGKWKYTD